MAQIRAAATSLALGMGTDGNASGKVTSATVNGQSFSMGAGMAGFTQEQRQAYLDYIIQFDELGYVPSRTAIPLF